MKTSNSGGNFKQPETGMQLGVLIKIIDLGTHDNPKFGNTRHEVLYQWELPDQTIETDDGEAPMVVGKFYNNSHNEKATLRLDLESWYGKSFDDKALDDAGGFDHNKVLGKHALLNLSENQNQKVVVASVNPVPQSMQRDSYTPHNTPFLFSIAEWDEDTFQKLGDWVQNKIKESAEYKVIQAKGGGQSENAEPAPDFDDDIPF